MTRHPDAVLAADGSSPASAVDGAGQTAIESQAATQTAKAAAARRKRKKPGPPCAACGRPIDPATGYAYVSLKAAALRELHYRDWLTQRMRGIVTAPPPRRIEWWFAHDSCSDADLSRVYVLRLASVSTDRKLLEAALAISFHRTIAANSEWQTMIRAVADARRRG